jgi:hypothetical protein
MCNDSLAIGGTVTRSFAQVVDGLEQHVADDGRLLAGRHVHGLDPLDGALPVVAEPHLARRLLHLLFLPGELLVGEGDELLGRVGDHLVGEVHDRAGAAAGGARNARVVGLARRAGLGDEFDAGDVALGRVLDEEVVDLRVAAEGVEVERPQRREPVEIVLPRPAAATAGVAAESFRGFDEPRPQALTLPRRIDGQHAEVAGFTMDVDIGARSHRAALVFQHEECARFHQLEHLLFVGAVADLEEVLDAVGERHEGGDGLRVARRGSTNCHGNSVSAIRSLRSTCAAGRSTGR